LVDDNIWLMDSQFGEKSITVEGIDDDRPDTEALQRDRLGRIAGCATHLMSGLDQEKDQHPSDHAHRACYENLHAWRRRVDRSPTPVSRTVPGRTAAIRATAQSQSARA